MNIKFSRPFYRFAKQVVRIVLLPFCRTKYTNKNNIPTEGRFVFAANHIAFTDPMLVGIGQKRPIRFMAKEELFRNKFLGWILMKLGAFPVERGKGDWNAIEYAKNLIDEGDALGVFIEGTRSKTGELLRPKSGAVMVAHQMDCKIVPVSITYRTKNNSFFSKRYVSFGEPVTCEELGITKGSPKEYRDASRKVMELITEMWEKDKYGNKTR